MIYLSLLGGFFGQIIELGGFVVIVQLCMSALSFAVVFYKLWQYHAVGVGRHRRLTDGVSLWNAGQRPVALERINESTSHLAPVIAAGLHASAANELTSNVATRLEAEAALRITRLESGFRILDNVAQLAPLMGLLGTVIGMIAAFRAMQQAGANIDPSVLAGGMWVALLTTAIGLVVAMPATIFLSWFESRVGKERLIAESMLQTILAPGLDFGVTGGPIVPGRPARQTLAHAV